MRMLLPFLIALGVLYFWDANYNKGIFMDGAKRLARDIEHNIR
jgi:hypothetical protein